MAHMRHSWFAALTLALLMHAPSAQAQGQQQWAAAYIEWRLPDQTGVDRIAQDIAVLAPSRASFFTLNWDFSDGDGGYIGLQTDAAGAGNVRFSLWNAIAARGAACRRFDGEGEGMTCVAPLRIETDRFYRVRVTRGEAAARGQWWSGWIDTVDANGQTQSFRIGELQIAPGLTEIDPASLYNFNEFWGDAVRECRQTPLSAALFAAPSIQRGASGAPFVARAPTGRRPEGHPCTTGRERTGATASHLALTLADRPAMIMVLGGDAQTNRAFAAQAANGARSLVRPD